MNTFRNRTDVAAKLQTHHGSWLRDTENAANAWSYCYDSTSPKCPWRLYSVITQSAFL